MMHRLLKWPLVIVLILCTLPAWGNDQSPPDPIATRWTGLFSDHDLHAQSKPATPSLYQTSFTVTSFTPSTASSRLRDLAPETNQARTQGFLSSTTWLNGILVTETELAQNQGGAGWLQSRIPGDTTGDASQRMIRLGLTGTAGSVRYGILSRSAGQAFLQVPDQTRREVWGEWTSGGTSFRSAIGATME